MKKVLYALIFLAVTAIFYYLTYLPNPFHINLLNSLGFLIIRLLAALIGALFLWFGLMGVKDRETYIIPAKGVYGARLLAGNPNPKITGVKALVIGFFYLIVGVGISGMVLFGSWQ